MCECHDVCMCKIASDPHGVCGTAIVMDPQPIIQMKMNIKSHKKK